MKSIKYLNYLIAVSLVGLWGCSNQNYRTAGEYDDMYGDSKSIVVASSASAKEANMTPSERFRAQNPTYTDSYDRSPEAFAQQEQEGSDAYFEEGYDENYVNSRNVYRDPSASGYSEGFSEGYSEGWNDFAWSQPVGWNSPFSRFNNYTSGWNSWNSPWGFNNFGGGWGSPFRSGLYLSYGVGFGNAWGSPWGYNNFGWNNWNSPWGYNNFGGWGSPYAFNSFGGGWGNPYGYGWSPYDRGNFFANNSAVGVGAERVTRSYGARNAGRSSSAYYNDNYRNSPRTAATTPSRGARTNGTYDGGNANSATNRNSVATRSNGRWVGDGSSTSTTRGSSATRSNSEAYSRSAAGTSESLNRSSSTYNRNTYQRPATSTQSRSSGSYIRSTAPSRSTYSRSSGTGTYTPSSRSSSSSRSYSTPSQSSSRTYTPSSNSRSSNNSYSPPARSSSTPSSSSGSSSRGSSSSSSSSSGSSSRGPR